MYRASRDLKGFLKDSARAASNSELPIRTKPPVRRTLTLLGHNSRALMAVTHGQATVHAFCYQKGMLSISQNERPGWPTNPQYSDHADAWNDFVDIISAIVAMTALGLTLWDPRRFLAADHYGGFAVGVIVIFAGIRVASDTSARLTDTMPDPTILDEIRQVALSVPGTAGVEKLFARSTGLQYHVDLHLEVDPEITVRRAHDIANEVRFAIRHRLSWVADVLIHVEPAPRQNDSTQQPHG